MKNETEWYDDAPMFKTQADRRQMELAQLRPKSEWFTFDELLTLRMETI